MESMLSALLITQVEATGPYVILTGFTHPKQSEKLGTRKRRPGWVSLRQEMILRPMWEHVREAKKGGGSVLGFRGKMTPIYLCVDLAN